LRSYGEGDWLNTNELVWTSSVEPPNNNRWRGRNSPF